jgi:hypothetical protein
MWWKISHAAQYLKYDAVERGFMIVPEAVDTSAISFLLDALAGLEEHRSRIGVRHLLSNPAGHSH